MKSLLFSFLCFQLIAGKKCNLGKQNCYSINHQYLLMFFKKSSYYNTDQVAMTNICLSNSLLSEYAEMLGFGWPQMISIVPIFSFLPPWPLTPASFVIKKEKSVWPALLYLLNRSSALVRRSTLASDWDSCLNVLLPLEFLCCG